VIGNQQSTDTPMPGQFGQILYGKAAIAEFGFNVENQVHRLPGKSPPGRKRFGQEQQNHSQAQALEGPGERPEISGIQQLRKYETGHQGDFPDGLNKRIL
jgi:hypothetical protein